jgi:hypothetical protein
MSDSGQVAGELLQQVLEWFKEPDFGPPCEHTFPFELRVLGWDPKISLVLRVRVAVPDEGPDNALYRVEVELETSERQHLGGLTRYGDNLSNELRTCMTGILDVDTTTEALVQKCVGAFDNARVKLELRNSLLDRGEPTYDIEADDNVAFCIWLGIVIPGERLDPVVAVGPAVGVYIDLTED